MPNKVKVLGIQITSETGNRDANLEKVGMFLEENSWFKPDLVVLPEVFNSGIDFQAIYDLAEEIPNGPTTHFLSSLAAKYNTNIVGGSYTELCQDGKRRNASVVFNREGKITAKYHKIHMFSHLGSREGEVVTAGNKSVIAETDIGKIGLSICYDLRFPELYRALNFAGAKIIVCPAAWPYPRLEHWLILNQARAIENLVYMISVNQVGKSGIKRTNPGHSMVIDPWGNIVASAGAREGVMLTEIDLDTVDKIREEFPVLNDRNLSAYKI